MWRVQGFVGRVLQRCHGSNPLRLPQSHPLEDEVISNSAVLSSSRHSSDSSSQREEDGERRKKQRTFQFGYAELPRYTALDAVGLGAAAVLFMQICKRIHSQFSSTTEPNPASGILTSPSSLHKCGYHILLEAFSAVSSRDVLPRGRSVLCLHAVPKSQNQDQSSAQSNSTSSNSTSDDSLDGSSEQDHLSADCSSPDHPCAHLNQDSPVLEESFVSASSPLQNETSQAKTETKYAAKDSTNERLAGAVLNLSHVGNTSVPVILNIIGLESAKREKYVEAFTCFLAAAQHGYNKAQFNTGVCYEKGRGVSKDKDKAVYYYKQAAAGGHRQAQYRYAKLLLTSRGHQSLEELNTAIDLLEQAAAAGLTKAQLCLASVYSQELVRDGNKSVQYLKMAAESGDDTALLFLGQCYESGFGVQQNLTTAIELFRKAAQAGSKQATRLLTPPNDTDNRGEDATLRSIRSAPCFPVADRQLQLPLSSVVSRVPPSTSHAHTLPFLPHSWSTGNLCAPSSLSSIPLHLQPLSPEGGTCHWTVGIG